MREHEAKALLDAERARLEQARESFLRGGMTEDSQRGGLGELSGMDEHVADTASETFDREVELGMLHEVQAEIEELARAERMLVAGRYGRCRACGDPIPDERLRAVPATELCIVHQGEAERADAALRRAIGHGAAELEAVAHLDLLPVEERAPTPLAAEEAAVHEIAS